MNRTHKAAVAEPLEGRQLFSTVFGLQTGTSLVAFDSATPGTILATIKLKGLQRREELLGIDYRPANNTLYGLGSSNRLYTINVNTGEAAAVGSTTFAVPLTPDANFGFDVNPAADRIRVTNDQEQNFRINPNDGTVVDFDANAAGLQSDPNIAYAAGDAGAGTTPDVFASAYTNNDTDGATSTVLFNIDAARNVLTRQGSVDGTISPNSGQQLTVGALGVDVLPIGGFDIETAGTSNTALAALVTNPRQASTLYQVNLDSGVTTAVGQIGRTRRPLLDIAVAPRGTTFFVVNQRNDLIRLNTETPSFILASNKISGLGSSRERVVGIDFRPLTQELWALTDAEQLYTINPATGAATAVGGESAVELTDRASVGFDFNPAADRIRVVNSAGQNIRFNPTTGAAIDFDPADPDIDPDTGLTFIAGDPNAQRTPRIVASAYTNSTTQSVPLPSPTTLYGIDSALDVLVTQGSVTGTPTSPNTGQLLTVGPTNVNVPDNIGFDIRTSGSTDSAFAVFAPGNRGSTGLYSVNLATGTFTLVTTLGKRVKGVTGFAVQP